MSAPNSSCCADSPEASADRALLARVVAGGTDGQRAFRTLYQRHERQVRAVASRIVRDDATTDEVVQDAFVRVWRHAADYGTNERPAAFSTWLYRIAFNMAIDALRRRGVANRGSIPMPDDDHDDVIAAQMPDPYEALVREREVMQLGAALDALKPEHSTMLLARAEGASYVEIAEAVGCPKGTVMSRLFYGRAELVDELARRGAEVSYTATFEETDPDGDVPQAFRNSRGARVGGERNPRAATYSVARTTMKEDLYAFLKGRPAVGDPHVVKIVAEGPAEGPFVPPGKVWGKAQTADLVDPLAPDAEMLRACYRDPDKFFEEWPEREKALSLQNSIVSLIVDGMITAVTVVTLDGDPDRTIYVKYGRTRTVLECLVWEALAGTRVIRALRAIVTKVRADNGPGWRPEYRVVGKGGVKDTSSFSDDIVAENTLRKSVVGERESFYALVAKFRAWEHAHRNATKVPPPPYADYARHYNISEGTAKGWHRLAALPEDVIEAVLAGAVALSAVMSVAKRDTPPEEVAVIVRTMIAEGATTARDAVATRAAIVEARTQPAPETPDEDPESAGDDGDATPTIARHGNESRAPRLPVAFAEKPLPAKFIRAFDESLAGKGNKSETLALACLKLASRGWAALTPDEKDAVKGVGALAATVEAARKAAKKRPGIQSDAE